MSKILENIRRKLSVMSNNSLFVVHGSQQFIESEKELLKERYKSWIVKKFLYQRFSMIAEVNPPTISNEMFISQWIPFLFEQPGVDNIEQLENSWSKSQKSVNIYLLPLNPFTFHRNPVANSTDAIRGKRGYSEGIHIWEINWPETMRGTHAVIGVATDKALLQEDHYVSLVGLDNESWGWDIVSRLKVHGKDSGNPICFEKYPDVKKLRRMCHMGKNLKIPQKIFVILDMFQGSLSFVIGNEFLGICHTGLQGKILYPTVSAVWGHCEVSMKYLNYISKEPPTLKSLCHYQARRLLRYHCRYNEIVGQHGRNGIVSDIDSSIKYSDVVMDKNIPNVLKKLLLRNDGLTVRF